MVALGTASCYFLVATAAEAGGAAAVAFSPRFALAAGATVVNFLSVTAAGVLLPTTSLSLFDTLALLLAFTLPLTAKLVAGVGGAAFVFVAAAVESFCYCLICESSHCRAMCPWPVCLPATQVIATFWLKMISPSLMPLKEVSFPELAPKADSFRPSAESIRLRASSTLNPACFIFFNFLLFSYWLNLLL